MDLEKIGHLLEESKGADVSYYLFLAFALVCPGFMVVYYFKPDLILSYDTFKLLLLCVSIGGTSLLTFFLCIWVCINDDDNSVNFRFHVVFAITGSIMGVVFGLILKESLGFWSGYFFCVGTFGATSSIVSSDHSNWFKRVFFDKGVYILLLVILLIAVDQGITKRLADIISQ